jgi:hypothetical protein
MNIDTSGRAMKVRHVRETQGGSMAEAKKEVLYDDVALHIKRIDASEDVIEVLTFLLEELRKRPISLSD